MEFKFFEEMKLSKVAKVPAAYSRQVRWLPQIGDIVPNFAAETTMGPLTFHSWAEGSWVFLFSHPAAFTPVCTTEVASFAASAGEFAKRGVKLLGISTSTIAQQQAWHGDIEKIYGLNVDMPMIADPDAVLVSLVGMMHDKQSIEFSVRKSIIIGPDMRVKMIFEYPAMVGRGTDETLRVINALQTVETYNVATSADWQKGDECLLLPKSNGRAKFDYGSSWSKVCSYLRVVADPWKFTPHADEDVFAGHPSPPDDPSGRTR